MIDKLPSAKDIEHPLYCHPTIWHFWRYCLRKAELEDGHRIINKKKISLKQGMFVIQSKENSLETGLSVRQIKYALQVLIKKK